MPLSLVDAKEIITDYLARTEICTYTKNNNATVELFG